MKKIKKQKDTVNIIVEILIQVILIYSGCLIFQENRGLGLALCLIATLVESESSSKKK